MGYAFCFNKVLNIYQAGMCFISSMKYNTDYKDFQLILYCFVLKTALITLHTVCCPTVSLIGSN